MKQGSGATRIAVFLPSVDGGGAERVMVQIAGGLAQRGFVVDLALGLARGPYLADVHSDVRVLDLQAHRVMAALMPLARYLERERPFALISALSHANVIALFARRLARSSTRVVVSERRQAGWRDERRSRAFGNALLASMRMMYPSAHAVVAVSNGVARDVAAATGLPVESIRTIYNPGPSPEQLARADVALDHPWFAAGQAPVIVAMGRLVEQKDFATLVDAFALLRARMASRLLILGEGPLRGDLIRRVRAHRLEHDVELHGFVDNPFPYLKRAALFVLSSRVEGLPGSLIQAMALGAPVVSTDCPSGPDEILEHGRWGRLVPVGDATAMANAMYATLLEPRSADASLGARRFTLDAAVDSYLDAAGWR